MNVYVNDGELYCEECSKDGDDGPHQDGGGEADYMAYCGECGVWLENPLTDDGVAYTLEHVIDYVITRRGNPDYIRNAVAQLAECDYDQPNILEIAWDILNLPQKGDIA